MNIASNILIYDIIILNLRPFHISGIKLLHKLTARNNKNRLLGQPLKLFEEIRR